MQFGMLSACQLLGGIWLSGVQYCPYLNTHACPLSPLSILYLRTHLYFWAGDRHSLFFPNSTRDWAVGIYSKGFKSCLRFTY